MRARLGKTRTDTSTMYEETSKTIARRTRSAIAVAAWVTGACLAMVAVPAAATVIHTQEGSFNGFDRPAPLEAFSYLLPSDAVDLSSGDVWVAEAKFAGVLGKADAIDKFSASGKYAGVQITGESTPQGEFSFGAGLYAEIAVDNTAAGPRKGDLYVSDTGHGVVDRFSSSGAFECQITGKVPGTAEEIGHECNGAAGSKPASGVGIEPSGLAVDASGDLYVADRSNEVIDKFGPNGEYKEQITNAGLASPGIVNPASIALDSAGNLYVTNFQEDVVKFDSSGHFDAVLTKEQPSGVGVDPNNNHVYVGFARVNATTHATDEGGIAEYEPSGALLDVFALSEEHVSAAFGTTFGGLAVGQAGKIYAAQLLPYPSSSSNILVYSPDTTIPTVTTQAATAVEEASATLHAHVDPDAAHGGGEVVTCKFEYGPTIAYGESAPCSPAPPYSNPEDASAALTRLRPSSTYHFRIEASNANGISSTGEDETLTTLGAPTIGEAFAEAETTKVTFRGKIDPWGYDTTCQIQYVADTAFEQSKWASATTVPCQSEDIGAGFGDVFVKARVSGLKIATAYHWRFLATNQTGVTGSRDQTFETYNIGEFKIEDLNAAGQPETQAGGHPYEIVTTVGLNTTTVYAPERPEGNETTTGSNVKDIHVALPPGMIGNPTATAVKCNRYLVGEYRCPQDSEIGYIEVWTGEWHLKGGEGNYYSPLFNLEPSGRYPAEFGAYLQGVAGVWIPFHVRSGSDYGVTADSIDISDLDLVRKVKVVIWGVPAAASHNAERRCPKPDGNEYLVGCADTGPDKPLLTNPTSCVGPQSATATSDTWQEPGSYVEAQATLPAFTGCGLLPFSPTLEALPTTSVADSPSGMHIDLHVPQPDGCKEEAGQAVCEDAEAGVKDATVALPAGMTVNPSSADGLEACSEAQIGYLSQTSAEAGRPQFTPEPAECPDAAKIGTVEVDSPLVDHPLLGAVYLAQQTANPFKSLLALYVAVYDAQTGVVVKLPGEVTADPTTGQLTATFDEDPQLPFEDFKLDLFSGSRASLTTPFTCGSYAASTDLTPWSAPEGSDAMPSSSPFQISGAPGGGACVADETQTPNAPGFEAGMASPVAGSYSPFVLKLTREDGSQHFSDLNVMLPPGLLGKVAGIEQCPQGDIEAAQRRGHEGEGAVERSNPSCPSGSEVGVVHVGVGSGAPYYATGHAYLAGPYEGAPFSLVIVTPAVAGPFDLGTVVVRAGLYINRSTAQVTVKSDPFPTILDGIPLDIRSIGVEVRRHEFTLNPTSCEVMAVRGEEQSTTGKVANLSSRFQAGGCTNLPFKPSLTASTQGAASRANGASLTVKLVPTAGQANIAKVELQLPKQLPSRLTTLRQACSEAQFTANPGGCPEGSFIGAATAHTPILSSPLTGPAILVSHGGAAFPDVEFVLQGENGVELILDGQTQITNGVTYSKFETVPDAPVSSFETMLPQGPHSVLATNLPASAKYSLCAQKLEMPTTITGQNGVVVKQTTKIAVTGCRAAKTRPLARARKLKAARKKCRTNYKGRKELSKRAACEKVARERYGSKANRGKR